MKYKKGDRVLFESYGRVLMSCPDNGVRVEVLAPRLWLSSGELRHVRNPDPAKFADKTTTEIAAIVQRLEFELEEFDIAKERAQRTIKTLNDYKATAAMLLESARTEQQNRDNDEQE